MSSIAKPIQVCRRGISSITVMMVKHKARAGVARQASSKKAANTRSEKVKKKPKLQDQTQIKFMTSCGVARRPLRSFALARGYVWTYDIFCSRIHMRPSSPIPGSPAPATLMFCPCMTPPPMARLRPPSWKSGLQGGECDL